MTSAVRESYGSRSFNMPLDNTRVHGNEGYHPPMLPRVAQTDLLDESYWWICLSSGLRTHRYGLTRTRRHPRTLTSPGTCSLEGTSKNTFYRASTELRVVFGRRLCSQMQYKSRKAYKNAICKTTVILSREKIGQPPVTWLHATNNEE